MARAKKETATEAEVQAPVEENAAPAALVAQLNSEIASAKHAIKSIQGAASADLRAHMHRIGTLAAQLGNNQVVAECLDVLHAK